MRRYQFLKTKATFPNGTFRKDDFFIIEDLTYRDFPKHCKEVKCITIILCEEGKLRYDIDGHTVIAEKNDIIIYSLGQRVKNYKVLSPTFSCKAILINADCLPMLKESINSKLMLEKKLLDTDTVKLGLRKCKALVGTLLKSRNSQAVQGKIVTFNQPSS